jgi:hypothetical protein
MASLRFDRLETIEELAIKMNDATFYEALEILHEISAKRRVNVVFIGIGLLPLLKLIGFPKSVYTHIQG